MTTYKKPHRLALAQSALKVYFVPDAEVHPKNRFCLRRIASHPLWWNVADSTFLPQAGASTSLPEISAASPEELGLPPFRSDPRAHVWHHHGPAPYQQDRNLAIQRSLSGNAGPGTIPRSVHPASISETPSTQGHPAPGPASRQPARPSLFSA